MKIRKRVILFAIAMGVLLNQFIMYESNKALAYSNWMVFSNDEKTFIDLNSVEPFHETIRYGSKIYSVWMKCLNKGTDSEKLINKELGKVFWYNKTQYLVDCSKKEISIKSIAYYDLENEPINGVSTIPDFRLNWNSIVPETVGEGLYFIACTDNRIDTNNNYSNQYLFQR